MSNQPENQFLDVYDRRYYRMDSDDDREINNLPMPKGVGVFTKDGFKDFSLIEDTKGKHYQTDDIECIDAIRSALGNEGFIAYCRGTVIKYTWRLGKKDDRRVDAGKALVYQRWIKETLEGKPLTKDN